MSTSEVRDRLDLPPIEDDEMSEAYRPPQQIEEAEEGDETQDEPFGGMFAEQAENAVSTELETRDLGRRRLSDEKWFVFRPTSQLSETHNGLEIHYPHMSEGDDVIRGTYEHSEGDVTIKTDSGVEEIPRDDETIVDLEDPEDATLEAGGTGNLKLVDESTPEFDRHYLEMLEGHAWAESTDRTLLAGSEVPEMVQDRLRDTILSGTLFSEIDAIPSSQRSQLREYMLETLTDSEGWTTDELAGQIEQLGVDPDRAETIARTESAAIVNSAREGAYEERGLEDARFKWVGVSDNRTTEACTWLKEQTNPKFGGEPVTLEELKELIAEAPDHDPDMQDNMARPDNYTAHINERHSYVRHAE